MKQTPRIPRCINLHCLNMSLSLQTTMLCLLHRRSEVARLLNSVSPQIMYMRIVDRSGLRQQSPPKVAADASATVMRKTQAGALMPRRNP